jgi:DNA-binding MarR family transcriptional regulator
MMKAGAENYITPWICAISRASSQYVCREMSLLGFGPGQFFFLAELFRNEGLTQDELSRRVGVDKSNTSRALAKLERYGLVRRERDKDNHRVRRVFLQPAAHAVKLSFFDIQARWNSHLMNGLSAGEKKSLLAAVRKIAINAGSPLKPKKTEGVVRR